MGVTELGELVKFLNWNPDEDLEDRNENPASLFFLKERLDDKKVKRVQRDIKEVLLPVVSTTESVSLDEAYRRISRLVEKINDMNLETRWAVEPVKWEDMGGSARKEVAKTASILHAGGLLPRDKKLGAVNTDEKYQRVVALFRTGIGGKFPINVTARKDDPTKLEAWGLRPEGAENKPGFLLSGKKINLLGHEWFFGKDLREVGFDATSAKRELYWIILDALQSNELFRLRKCPECEKLFVAEDPREKYCLPTCKRERDTEDAAIRMKASRQRKKMSKQERKGLEEFSRFMRIAMRKVAKKQVTEQDLVTLRLILETLGKGDIKKGAAAVKPWFESKATGVHMLQIWNGLRSDLQAIFKARS